MATPQRDVLYIDIDDEITGIIDKLHTSKSRIVALVLPKRATMLQSSVNMKLLKKAAADDKKRLVLITSEAGLLPLAGASGLYVAKTLQSKPEVPEIAAGALQDMGNSIETVSEDDEFDPVALADRPVGELAATDEHPATKTVKPQLRPMPIPVARAEHEDEAIELDNSPVDENVDMAAEEPVKSAKKSKDKGLKVPNFNKFRTRLIIGILILILLIVGFIIANIVLPAASVVIATQTSTINSDLTLALSTSATSVDPSTLTIPAYAQQTQKTESQQVPTTGQQNNGQKASGSVSLITEECTFPLHKPASLPAGTGLTANGLTFITQQNTTFSNSGYPNSAGNCIDFPANNSTPVQAQQGGSNYNLNSATFDAGNGVSGTGTTTGGTDSIVQVVAQADITNATQKLAAINTASIKTGLENSLKQAGYFPIPGTFVAGTPTMSTSANVGDQATTVTVTQTVSYTMLGVHRSDLQSVLDNSLNSQIDPSKQSIQNDGLSSATFAVSSPSTNGAQVSMQTTAIAGPKLNASSLKKLIAGKKPGQANSLLTAYPGVTGIQVHLSPFWVSSIPTNTSKITIRFASSHAASS